MKKLKQLPPDPDNLNDERAAWACSALKAFRAATGSCTRTDEAMGDLLGDLRHLCDRRGWDWHTLIDRANRYYADETAAQDATE